MALNINGTTGISGVDGTVSAPALTGTDSNTGITFPSADTIKFSTGGVERMQITNSGVTGTGIGAGKILQVVQTIKSDAFTTTSTSATDITGLSVDITPSSSSSKILVFTSIDAYVQRTSSYNASGFFILLRGSTGLQGVHMRTRVDNSMTCNYILAGGNAVMSYLDSPATTSAVTYKVQCRNWTSSQTISVNEQTGSTYYAASTIIAQEVAA